MQYDIDFIGVKTVDKNADAIAMRWRENDNVPFFIGVYDGGYQAHGEELCNHIKKYYGTEHIDFVVCSHPDADHASGLATLLENLTLDRLYMNIPWLYIDELFDKVNDGRITKKSLEERLKEKYPYVDAIELTAKSNNVPIYPYQDYLAVGREDDTIPILFEINNLCRNLLSVALIVSVYEFIQNSYLPSNVVLLDSCMLVLLAVAYRKQTNYVRQRVENILGVHHE